MLPTALGALVLALAGWGAWPAHPAPLRAPRGLWQFTSGAGIQHEPAWSPDNNAIAYASDSGGNFDVWVQGLSEPPVRITTSSEYDGQPAWSPDAQWIVFRSERDGGGLFVVSAHGGPERRLTTFGFTPQWSPAGDNILFLASPPDTAASLRLYVVESMGGTPRGIRTSGDLTLLSAAWHPDGRRISMLATARGTGLVFRTQSIDGRDVLQSPIASDVRDRLALADLTFSHFSWASNGRFLYLDGMSRDVRNLWRIGIEPETLAWTTGPDRLTTGAGADGEISPSPDGSRLAFSVNVGRPMLWSFPFDPVKGRILGSGEPATAAAERGGDVQRKGGRLVYRAVRGALDELWEHSPEGERLLLADAHASLSSPHWSPDGQRVVFVRRRQGRMGTVRDASLAVLAVSGGQEQALTTPSSAVLIPTEWSSDGAWILASCPSREFRTAAICLLPVAAAPHAERELRLVSARAGFDLYQQRFSPDERWISFMAVPRDDRSTSAIYVMPRDGGTWVPITDGHAYDDKPRWSPDGRTLYFISNRDGHFNVWARRFDGRGSPTGEVFRVTAFSRSNRRLAPHLRELDMAVLTDRVLLPMDESSSQVWILERADR
jgi:Tol biopolymer transport system component